MIIRFLEGIERRINAWEVRVIADTERDRLTLRFLEGGTITAEEYWRRIQRLPVLDIERRLGRAVKKIKRR